MTPPMGRVLVSFVPDTPYGVLDHTVTLPTGESTLNPMRVIALDAGRCEVVFTLRRGSMSDQEFEEDARAVAGDLARSEERRVGKECRSRRSRYQCTCKTGKPGTGHAL